MCHGPSAHPPIPPSGPQGSGGRLTLGAADGAQFGAFWARAAAPRAPGVVILPDVRGLHRFYEELALRFGESGSQSVAIDYYGRTAGLASREDGFQYQPHLEAVSEDSVAMDVAAAVAHLRSEGQARAVLTVGFCFGGRQSFNQAARGHGLAGVIGFYGRVGETEPGDRTAPMVLAQRYACPVLGLFGGADPGIGSADVTAFRRALDAAGVGNEIVVYPDAPHSFFDRAFADHAEACADAWSRVLGFIDANS